MIYVFFTYEGLALPIAYTMQAEGSRVRVGQVQDQKELKITSMAEEKSDEKERRLSLYDGMLDKVPAKRLVEQLKQVPDKDEYFIFFDFNNLWRYSEELLDAGFTQGMFPLSEDWHYEEDRIAAKEFVKKHYPHMKVAEIHEFSTVKEGLAFLKQDKHLYVLKSKGNNGRTVVPQTSDLHLAYGQLEEAMRFDKKNYEKDGFVLERMIVNVKECIVEMVWYDGRPVYALIDLENKYIGSGNIGQQVGCAMGLRFEVPLDCELVTMAFPPEVHKEAKRRWGMFVWDAGLLWDEDTENWYFTEFCPNRVGYDSFFAELEMADGPTRYFEQLQRGESPLAHPFGATVRVFNQHRGSGSAVLKDALVELPRKSRDRGIWMFDIKQDEKRKKMVTAGYEADLGVAAAASSLLQDAVTETYERLRGGIIAEGMYYRPQFDFESRDYPTSIYNRYKFFDSQGMMRADQQHEQTEKTPKKSENASKTSYPMQEE